jgi:hypothetical protein
MLLCRPRRLEKRSSSSGLYEPAADEVRLRDGDARLINDTDLPSPPFSKLGVPVKFRSWLTRLDVRTGRFTECEMDRRDGLPFGVFGGGGMPVESAAKVDEVGLEAWLEVRFTLGGCGNDPMLIVFLRGLPCEEADPVFGICARGTLDVDPCEGERKVGRLDGEVDDVDFRVFATGSEGRGPLGGRDGRGRAVAVIFMAGRRNRF